MCISTEKLLSKYKININILAISKLLIATKCGQTNKVSGF